MHQGQTVLITEEDGQINWPSHKGLYFFDTRVVSSWSIYANGQPWELLNGGTISYYASRIYITTDLSSEETARSRALWASPSADALAVACTRTLTTSTTGHFSARNRGALRFC
jgi:glycogen debranching enzyme-like protein